jgi:hypothetical protein
MRSKIVPNCNLCAAGMVVLTREAADTLL